MRNAVVFAVLLTVVSNVYADFVPYLVKDLAPGHRIAEVEPSYYDAKSVGEVVFFTAITGKPGLWRTDGTAAASRGRSRAARDVS